MRRHKRTLLLVAVMALVSVSVGASAIYVLYRAALSEHGEHLTQTVRHQADLIDVFLRAREEVELRDTESSLEEQSLLAIADLHRSSQYFGESGECTLARRSGDTIEFLISRRFAASVERQPIPWESTLADPMRQALSGMSGLIIAQDYRGETVLAAYEPIAELDWGIVAKIDLREIRSPFVGAAFVVSGAGLVAILIGAALFLFITNPLLARLARSEAHNRSIIETAADGIITIDSEGIVETFNASAEKIFGYRADEVIGENVKMLMPPEIETAHDGYLRQYLDTGQKNIIGKGREVLGKRKDGTFVPLHLAVSEMHVDSRRVFTGILDDISEQKRAEFDLRRAKEAAEEANTAKSRFLSLMSHELRTPLNSVIGFTDLLGQKLYGPLNEKQNEYVQMVGESGKHLLSMINDLLDVAKIDAQFVELNPEHLRLEELIAMPLQTMKSQFLKKAIVVDTSVEGPREKVYVDRRKCNQIMLNLLSNAAKFTPAGGTIQVTAALNADAMIEISITDTGPGIAPEDKDRVFEEFYQVDPSRDSSLGGTGIGLALSRKLVEIQGGQISVRSEPGCGSTFTFTIPRELGERRKAAPDTPAESNGSPRDGAGLEWRILVAEDNDANLKLLIDTLTAAGHDVAVARNGREAIEVAHSYGPQVMLFDLQMPEMGGIEAIEKLRALPEFAHTPIIAITANADSDTIGRCEAAGYTDHLTKPIQSGELLELLRRVT